MREAWRALRLLAWLRARSAVNSLRRQTAYERVRNGAFAAAGLGLLAGLHLLFMRLLGYLATVEIVGVLLIWKLTAMMMLTTFSMVVLSSLLTSLSTLYYSYDLKFLFKAPVPLEAVFLEKALESVFFASWMIGLVLIPYVAALARVLGMGAGFWAAFAAALVPYLLLAGAGGILFSMAVLYLFPSSRTRDVIYILSSFSMAMVYGLIRFSQPERLVRPDALHVVAEYLNFLQAPTAPCLPSWWLTEAMAACAQGRGRAFWGHAALLAGTAILAFAALTALARRLYFPGFSGAQAGGLRRLPVRIETLPESRWLGWLEGRGRLAALFWRERKGFFRDVKHWSQIMLVLGLIFVYVFSIRRLPMDSPDLRSLLSFLNVGTAGFVIAALGLRFTYPSISLEGRSFWVVMAAPVGVPALMTQKFLFSALPMTGLAMVLGGVTNSLLDADPFTSWLTASALVVMTWVLCGMGVGYGALFPMFTVENIHQIESSLGGFVYMASALSYVGFCVMVLSWPMHMHFQARFGNPDAWHWPLFMLSVGSLGLVSASALVLPWRLGERALRRHEGQ